MYDYVQQQKLPLGYVQLLLLWSHSTHLCSRTDQYEQNKLKGA